MSATRVKVPLRQSPPRQSAGGRQIRGQETSRACALDGQFGAPMVGAQSAVHWPPGPVGWRQNEMAASSVL